MTELDVRRREALALLDAQAWDQAAKVLTEALAAAPQDLELWSLLADTYELAGDPVAALKACHRLTKLAPAENAPRLKAGRIRMKAFDYGGAEAEFRTVLAAAPDNTDALDGLADTLRLAGNVTEARDVLLKRAAVGSDRTASALARFKAASTQPVIARSEGEIEEARARYAAALAKGPEVPIDDPFRAGLGPNFFLNYQARNDRPLQEALAAYFLAATPSLGTSAPHVGRSAASRRMRVGIVSAFFGGHTVGYLSRGLITGLDRARFDVTVFRTPSAAQSVGSDTVRWVDLPADLAAARALVAAEELDILHFPEIGMDHFTYFLAFARLATLQTVGWGHPVTTGLPHIDLFISVDDMEPAGGARHYREELIRLKSLSFAGERPPLMRARRGETGLEPGPAYVCAQSLYKVHPRFDAILAQILRDDPKGIVYFISGGAQADTIIKNRLAESLGGDAARVRILPRLKPPAFLNLVGAADVALDVPQWSGGKTSLETLSMGTPIVHMPGEFMRGRHTLAFYRRMDVTDPVVETPEDYARTAVRLMHDSAFRADVRGQIEEAQSKLFEDWASVREIEDLWTAALKARS